MVRGEWDEFSPARVYLANKRLPEVIKWYATVMISKEPFEPFHETQLARSTMPVVL